MKFTKFLFVGLLGTITNISIFYVFVDRLFYPPIQISITGFILASIQNYIFHNNWTFLNESKKRSLSKTDYFKYLSVSVMSLVVNLSVLQFILVQYNPSIILNPGIDFAAIVRIGPAATKLTRILSGPNERAKYLEADSRAALDTPIQL